MEGPVAVAKLLMDEDLGDRVSLVADTRMNKLITRYNTWVAQLAKDDTATERAGGDSIFSQEEIERVLGLSLPYLLDSTTHPRFFGPLSAAAVIQNNQTLNPKP